MIILIHGKQREKSRVKAHEILEAMQKKRPDAEIFKIEGLDFDIGKFNELIYGQGLFASKYIVFADNIFDDELAEKETLERIKDIKEAENAFVFLESDLSAKTLKEFEKSSERVFEFGSKSDTKPTAVFNIFSLGEALGMKDKKNLWVLLQKAFDANLSPEEIHGTLFWQVKSIASAIDARRLMRQDLSHFHIRRQKSFQKISARRK